LIDVYNTVIMCKCQYLAEHHGLEDYRRKITLHVVGPF